MIVRKTFSITESGDKYVSSVIVWYREIVHNQKGESHESH